MQKSDGKLKHFVDFIIVKLYLHRWLNELFVIVIAWTIIIIFSMDWIGFTIVIVKMGIFQHNWVFP